MPIHTGNSVAFRERRLRARQRLSGIVYLDIGAGNGGIVLNLSDEGLGFQAVGPLGKQKELLLRIKLPSSQTRIEVTAQIAWISDSNRQAGVRFLEGHSDGIVQIQEWIRSQAAPPAPCEDSSKQPEAMNDAQQKQETGQESRDSARFNSISEIQPAEPIRQEPLDARNDGTREPFLIERDDPPASSPAPELVSQTIGEPGESIPSVPLAEEQASPQGATSLTPEASLSWEPDVGDAAIVATRNDNSGGESALGWPTPISRAAAMAIPLPPDAPLKPVNLFVAAAESKTNSTPSAANTKFAGPAAINTKFDWNHATIAGFFVLCAALCFGIGTWVGLIVTRRHSPDHAAASVNAPVTAAQNTAQSMNGSAGGNTENNTRRLAPAAVERVHTEPAASRSSHQNQKVTPSAGSADVPPVETGAPSSLQYQDVTANAGAKEQEGNLPVAAAVENSAAPEKNLAAPAITKEREGEPQAAPAMENSSAATPSPRMVAGLILKPSDRFNPCHLAYRVEAAYPMEALAQRIEGVVKIQQMVGVDGRVSSVKLLSGPPVLAPAALEAARYWRYLPALLNGQPVETEQDIQIEFRLPE
jgi:TonB family protein